jgi:midasin
MVEYLAAVTGHACVRINNHEHTDMAEYLGSYVTDAATGQLAWSEGLLVRALKGGQWIILDELNLAPSEVLEALNRLLDDNRELYVPETQETVRPHAHFALFATQNPVGLYGGRKPLSQALRNRSIRLPALSSDTSLRA